MPQQAAQQGQRGKPKVQGLTSQTGLPAGTFYGSSGKLPLPLERSTAGGAAAAAGGASGRAPMRGKGKQPQRRKGGEDSDGDYVPDQAAAVQGSDDDSLMGPTLGGRRGRPHTRRGAKQQQADVRGGDGVQLWPGVPCGAAWSWALPATECDACSLDGKLSMPWGLTPPHLLNSLPPLAAARRTPWSAVGADLHRPAVR